MARRTRRLVADFGLGETEAIYLSRVEHAASTLPSRVRIQFSHDVAEMLAERPPAVDMADLEDALGSPVTLVEEFRREHGWDGRIGVLRRFRAVRLWVRWVVPITVLLLAVGGVLLGRHYAATPDLGNACGGVVASEFETLEAAGVTEYRVTYRQGERLGLYVCVYSQTPGVEIIELARPVAPRGAFQPVGTEVDAEDPQTLELVGDASRSAPYDASDGGLVNAVLWYEMEYCNSAGGTGFSDLHVTYRYRGRTRTAVIPLGYTLTVWAGGQCTDEVRGAIERESAAWSSVTGRSLDHSTPMHALEPYGLWPESVSRDLCRYLRGVTPPSGALLWNQFEPLSKRAIFLLDDPDLARTLIEGAVMGICPEFEDRRDELVAMLDQ